MTHLFSLPILIHLIVKARNFRYFLFFLSMMVGCNDISKEEKFFDDTGSLEHEVTLLNGQRHGSFKKYFRDGSLREQSHWNAGIKDGDHIFYYHNGSIKAVAPFVNGEQKGWVNQYDSLGNLSRRFYFEEGAMNGMHYEYYPDGKVAVEGNYERGKLDGKVVEYSESGEKKLSLYYEQGENVYYKQFDTLGFVRQSKLPFGFSKYGDSLKVELLYSDIGYDSLGLGMIVAELTSENQIEVAIDTLVKRGNKISVNLDKYDKNNCECIEGIIYEIKKPNRIEGRYHFRFPSSSD